MKFNYKKVATVLGSALMLGSTVAMAAAASFTPASFSDSGIALIVGRNAAISDGIASTVLTANLAPATSTTTSTDATVTGGDSYRVERGDNTRFNLGDYALDVVSGTLTDDDLSTALKDGEYLDNDNDEFQYTQKITLSNFTLSMFEDSDYKSDDPTVGVMVSSGNHVLNYSLQFSSDPEWGDLANTEIELMGKTYFVSSVTTNTTINLLDTANTATIAEGETITVDTHSVQISALSGAASAPSVKLSVDGQLTNSLSVGQTYKLADGTYVGIKDISMRDVAGTTASVEFSIGTGKIELKHNVPVRINDATVNGLSTYLTNSAGDKLNKIVLTWNADGDEFAAGDEAMIMPGLENVKISFGGMTYSAEEEITLEKGSNLYMRLTDFPLKDGNANIDLMYGNGTVWQGTGKESGKGLLTNQTSGAIISFDADLYQYFVASYDDGTNKESYLMRTTGFGVKADGTTNTTDVQYWKDTGFTDKKKEAAAGDTINLGSVSFTLGAINRDDKTVVIDGGSNVYFDRLFSKEGLLVYLPVAINAASYSADAVTWPQFEANTTATDFAGTTYLLGFREATKTGATATGNTFNATLGWTSSKATVSAIAGETPDGGKEIGDSDVFRSFVYGDLATELLYDTNGDQDSVKIVYHSEEAYGNIFVSETAATISGGSTGSTTVSGVMTFYDDEISSVPSTNNLIVIGGSAVNSVASELLGGIGGGDAFTTATGVKSGEFLIQSFARGDRIALLVAGYNAADTTKAITYLSNNAVNTAVGTKVVKSAATYADVV